MISIGRVCVKIAGRDAGLKCVVIDILDKNFVLVDGQTRRRRVNLMHLEPTAVSVDIAKNASHEEVVKALKPLGIDVLPSKPKEKPAAPRHARKKKEPKPAAEKPGKKRLDSKVEVAAKAAKPIPPSPAAEASSVQS